MKQIYLQPKIEVFSLCYSEGSLMAATIESDRNLGGGPTEEGMPTVVGETDNNNNGYGYGVGDPGNPIGGGNRSKGGLWDDWDDEE